MSDTKNNQSGQENAEERLYNELGAKEYKDYPYEVESLGEGMAVVKESMYGWWKPRYLVNHNTKRAYEFIDAAQKLLTVTRDDINWYSLEDVSVSARNCARSLSFHYPSFIHYFVNGVAKVSWQLCPDGRYHMDSDGFGMTGDEEVEVYGFIDQNAKVVVKFRYVEDLKDLDEMRIQAEKNVSL